MMNEAFLLLGGNLGDVAATFNKARTLVSERLGEVLSASSLYKSEPWGFESRDMFLNQVLKIVTDMDAETLMQQILDIEQALGRQREKGKLTSRFIDLDLLFFNDLVIDRPHLQVPHPRLHLRRFTLLPLAEITPEKVHPGLNKSVKELLDVCPDHTQVVRLDDPSQV
ncbi:MAG: 2-amino-4-hydroxy-6-hydroxymethyldihydropteridine diphosphokinase [Bacteroidales bacterium]